MLIHRYLFDYDENSVTLIRQNFYTKFNQNHESPWKVPSSPTCALGIRNRVTLPISLGKMPFRIKGNALADEESLVFDSRKNGLDDPRVEVFLRNLEILGVVKSL
jgi:hypothetical protein